MLNISNGLQEVLLNIAKEEKSLDLNRGVLLTISKRLQEV